MKRILLAVALLFGIGEVAHADGLLAPCSGLFCQGPATANSGVLVTSGAGVPSISSTLPNGLALGTPGSVTLTNATGLPIAGITGLGTGVGTALSAAVSGSGGICLTTNCVLVTPTLGVATATSINKVAITAPATGSTLTIADGKTLTDTSGVGANLLLGATGGGFAAYGGATCTNQFLRVLSSAGAGTCASVAIGSDVSGLGTGVATLLSGNASGTGGPLGTTSPTITTPGIVGVTNASNATAGNVGEYNSANVTSASAVAITTATPQDVTSVSLTAGDWDVEGNVIYKPAVGTSTTIVDGWVNTTSASAPSSTDNSGYAQVSMTAVSGSNIIALATGMRRVNVNTTTTVYLSCQATFTLSTAACYGTIRARRVR